jgi:DNA-binding beta-propeller fold protein YncE
MRLISKLAMAAVCLGLAGCGASAQTKPTPAASDGAKPAKASASTPSRKKPPARLHLQALVTAQTEDRLFVVDLPSGRVVRRVAIPGSPEYVAATASVIAVVGTDSGTVTLLNRRTLRAIRVFQGFSSPHIPAVSPDGRYAYVTDDASGALSVIALRSHRITARVRVGAGAHHLAFTPDARRVWIALGQAAPTIVILTTVQPSGRVDEGHPRLIGSLHPGFLAHDLLFSPAGDRVWVTSADTSYVSVFSVRSRRLLFRVAAGTPPQHLVFSHGYAYITSGYGSSIEKVSARTGRVLRRTSAPYGSFDLDASGAYVATASLMRGTLAVYGPKLRLLWTRPLAPSTEDVALSSR